MPDKDVATPQSLTRGAVADAVYSYEDPAITDQLYAFGSVLLNEIGVRATQIDTKATTAMGWSTAILAFLLAQLGRVNGKLDIAFTIIAATLAFAAAALAFAAIQPRTQWEWPSDLDWFQRAAFPSADRLKRYHVRSIHGVRQAQLRITEDKGVWLRWSYVALVASAFSLATGLWLKLLVV